LIEQQQIEQAASLLLSSDVVKTVILFGSYARGDCNEHSDVDLLVIETNIPSKVKEIVRLRRLVRPLRLPIDIMAVTGHDVEAWGAIPGTALYWALKEGKVVDIAAT
jgi:predicted nucleotidyltransferase